MQIADSTNGQCDDFRWSVYNTNGARLFTLDFDNSSFRSRTDSTIAPFVPTGLKFDNEGFYDLAISMNFGGNLWSATL